VSITDCFCGVDNCSEAARRTIILRQCRIPDADWPGRSGYSRSAIAAANAKLTVAAIMRPAESRPTRSPQRLKGRWRCCAECMDYFLYWPMLHRERRHSQVMNRPSPLTPPITSRRHSPRAEHAGYAAGHGTSAPGRKASGQGWTDRPPRLGLRFQRQAGNWPPRQDSNLQPPDSKSDLFCDQEASGSIGTLVVACNCAIPSDYRAQKVSRNS
jgi:hypothetical protein